MRLEHPKTPQPYSPTTPQLHYHSTQGSATLRRVGGAQVGLGEHQRGLGLSHRRLGLFAGSGVGKSVLLGMMTKYTNADVVVVSSAIREDNPEVVAARER